MINQKVATELAFRVASQKTTSLKKFPYQELSL